MTTFTPKAVKEGCRHLQGSGFAHATRSLTRQEGVAQGQGFNILQLLPRSGITQSKTGPLLS